MCVNYRSLPAQTLQQYMNLPVIDSGWADEVWQDYAAPIVVTGERGDTEVLLASYGMVPKRKLPPGAKHYATMNARAETVGQLKSYKTAWARQYRCLVPMQAFYEPCYESGRAERYRIAMANETPFAVAGIWRPWAEEDGGYSFSFSQITVNADQHPLMRRMHKPGDEKRSLVIVARADYDGWLNAATPEEARSLLRLPPDGALSARAAEPARNASLF
ncbi:Putative SOS response-associated peptidase YedK [Andreprevotia lacus DSM 23236]|jgi:putative SOS response-associated peptidase YedK|uniref:Abasic site processing protein n=2 Tax=Andreprevotia TaxID=397275 RepID=A0A1W1X8G2_9NEIS|nr:Putative SOS response-associated peptidase YedK [Andreprevotia lacus DSM 23236]